LPLILDRLSIVFNIAEQIVSVSSSKDLMFSFNATIGVTNKGDQRSYGGGFRWHF